MRTEGRDIFLKNDEGLGRARVLAPVIVIRERLAVLAAAAGSHRLIMQPLIMQPLHRVILGAGQGQGTHRRPVRYQAR